MMDMDRITMLIEYKRSRQNNSPCKIIRFKKAFYFFFQKKKNFHTMLMIGVYLVFAGWYLELVLGGFDGFLVGDVGPNLIMSG